MGVPSLQGVLSLQEFLGKAMMDIIWEVISFPQTNTASVNTCFLLDALQDSTDPIVQFLRVIEDAENLGHEPLSALCKILLSEVVDNEQKMLVRLVFRLHMKDTFTPPDAPYR